MDHASFVEPSLLSPSSILSSSSHSRFLSAIDDGLGRPGSFSVPEYFVVFESFDVDV